MIENKTLTNKISKFKKQFDIYKDDFTKCFDKHKKENETILCHKCLESYIILNDYYFNIGGIKFGINGICMDIVDWVSHLFNKEDIIQFTDLTVFWKIYMIHVGILYIY